MSIPFRPRCGRGSLGIVAPAFRVAPRPGVPGEDNSPVCMHRWPMPGGAALPLPGRQTLAALWRATATTSFAIATTSSMHLPTPTYTSCGVAASSM
jgi:hypothetical protein